MSDSVRKQILDTLFARLGALAGVGQVLESDGGEIELTPDLSAGKYVLEVYVGDDVKDDQQELNTGNYVMPVAIVAHLPRPDPAHGLGTTWRAVADTVCQRLYGTYGPADKLSMDGLARDCDHIGGGGLAIDPNQGTLCTLAVVEIHYAHPLGDTTEAA